MHAWTAADLNRQTKSLGMKPWNWILWSCGQMCIWINVNIQFKEKSWAHFYEVWWYESDTKFMIQLYCYVGSSGKFCTGKFKFSDNAEERPRVSGRQGGAVFCLNDASTRNGIVFDSVAFRRWRTGNNIFKQYHTPLCFRGRGGERGARRHARQRVKFGKFTD